MINDFNIFRKIAIFYFTKLDYIITASTSIAVQYMEFYTYFQQIVKTILQKIMPEKRQWTADEDNILRHLYENQKMKKWSSIAQRMAEEFKMVGRNGKQCKQRYQTAIDNNARNMLHTSWTLQQEKQMNKLHDQIGNKWALIANKIEGRTDNCVKNHFYSKLRKALRKLNKQISKNFKRQVKEIRPTVLYKIIEATDEFFKSAPTISKELTLLSRKLKTQLLEYSNDNDNIFEENQENLKQLAKNIHHFNKNYKRRPKKARRGIVQAQNLMSMPKIEKFKCVSDDQDDNSDYQLGVSEEQSIQIVEKPRQQEPIVVNQATKLQRDFMDYSKSSFKLRRFDGSYFSNLKQSQDNNIGIESLLKNAGVLEDADIMAAPFMKQSISQCSQSDLKQRNTEKFHLGQSLERLRCSIILKQDPEIDQQNKLFKSN